jgi:hypothetical protein
VYRAELVGNTLSDLPRLEAPMEFAVAGYGIIGILVIILLVVLIVYFLRRA